MFNVSDKAGIPGHFTVMHGLSIQFETDGKFEDYYRTFRVESTNTMSGRWALGAMLAGMVDTP